MAKSIPINPKPKNSNLFGLKKINKSGLTMSDSSPLLIMLVLYEIVNLYNLLFLFHLPLTTGRPLHSPKQALSLYFDQTKLKK